MKQKNKAFTLIELLIAMTMLASIILVISTTVSQIYFQQKRISIRQNFHNEARFMMEKIVQLVRNNTLDYDRYFVHYGAGVTFGSFSGNQSRCSDFKADTLSNPTLVQIPIEKFAGCLLTSEPISADPCFNSFLYVDGSGDIFNKSTLYHLPVERERSQHNRETIGYETLFSWDTDNDGIQDRQLGGYTPSSGPTASELNADRCTEAFSNQEFITINDIFLINASRTIRTHIALNDTNVSDDAVEFQLISGATSVLQDDYERCDEGEDCIIELSRDFAQDLDGDNRADAWSTECNPIINGQQATTLGLPVGDCISDEDRRYIQRGHELVNITPEFLNIVNAQFNPAPNRDPYLATRVDSVQIQPHVYMDISFELKNPAQYRFTSQPPNTRLQTTATSRVYGNTRR